MRRIIPAILLIAVLAIGGGIIASAAYQAGLQTAVATTAEGTAPRSSSPPTPSDTAGTHSGSASASSGFLGALLFFFLVVGLIRVDLLRRSAPPSGRTVAGVRAGRRARAVPTPEAATAAATAAGRPSSTRTSTNGTAARTARSATDRDNRAERRPDRPDAPGSGRLTSVPAPPGHRPGGASAVPHPTTMPPMRTVLVVDDEAQDRRSWPATTSSTPGFAVLTASDGPSALEAVRRRRPDLVVLDLGLPGLDGLDVTRELRRDSDDADRDADRPRRRARQARRPRARRRRLRHQAVQPARARRARQGRAASDRGRDGGGRGHPRRRRRPRHAAHADRGRRPDRGPHADRVRAAGDDGRQSGPDLHPLTAPGRRPRAWRSSRTSGRSTPTSRTCAARSSRIRASPATCSPSTASATASPTTAERPVERRSRGRRRRPARDGARREHDARPFRPAWSARRRARRGSRPESARTPTGLDRHDPCAREMRRRARMARRQDAPRARALAAAPGVRMHLPACSWSSSGRWSPRSRRSSRTSVRSRS